MKTFSIFRWPMQFALMVLFMLSAVAWQASQAQDAPAEKPPDNTADKAAEPAAAGPYEIRWEEREFKQVSSSCYTCHETLSLKLGRPARQHITSAHFRASVTCHECHGGDPTKDTTDAAHDTTKGFIGKLNAEQMNTSCGKCHSVEVESFTKSKHMHDYEDVRKLSCKECHGAHDIGARDATHTWAAKCQECHELEDVPDLPAELMTMMKSKDELHEKIRKLRYKLENKPFPAEVMEPFREVRQLSANVVHATRAKNIGGIMNEIVTKDKALEEKIDPMIK